MSTDTGEMELTLQDDIKIWMEFLVSLKKDELTHDRFRPYDESLRARIMEFLTSIREKVSWDELEAVPEIHRVGNQIHYLVPLTFDDERVTFCFTLLMEGNDWYFRHLESIFIRLDEISSPPTSTFPDLPEAAKAWMREEIRVTKQVILFNFLSKEKGRDFAFNWFRDGAGYFLSSRTWVPFVPESKAFILYACWEQAKLRGNNVILEELNDDEAIVRIKSNYLKLYADTAHLKPKISLEDYRQIFEKIWKDRAGNAGWDLQITYHQEECLFHFEKKLV